MTACAFVNEATDVGVGLVQTRYATWLEPLPLDSGLELAPVTLAYETYGTLNADSSNAILLVGRHGRPWPAIRHR